MAIPKRFRRLLVCVSLLSGAACSPGLDAGDPAPLTYNRDIAPLLWHRCGDCHRPGQMAPFSLLQYDDVKPRAAEILDVTTGRTMPPWLPEPGYGRFADDRRLTDEEMSRLRRWVEDGAVEGDPRDRRAPPTRDEGWQLGKPDIVVELSDTYMLQPGTTDVFRNFVLPVPVPSTRYVRGMEVRPGNRRVVHHATVGVDSSRASRLLDEIDPEPGYEGMFSSGAHSPDSHALGWTPGMTPRLDPPDTAWRLDAGDDLVVQLHLMPAHVTKPEPVRPSVGLYFSNSEPTAETVDFKLGSKLIDIPPGEANYVVTDTYALPVDVDTLSVYPHAHYLGKEMKVFATRPDGRVEWLLWIKQWNFNWQDQYQFATPVFLPRGTTLTMQYSYDNSAANANNPSRPPVRVEYGPRSSDEMGDVWLRFVPRTRRDASVLAQSFLDNELRKNLAAAEKGLADHPGDGRWLALVGARYFEAGRTDEAVSFLRRARDVRPRDPEIRNNLGAAFRDQGRLAAAVVELTIAAKLASGNAQIQVNLADALQDSGDLVGAIRHFRAALALNPAAAESHNNLGVALASSGDLESALNEFRRALEIRPDYADAQANLALALEARGAGR